MSFMKEYIVPRPDVIESLEKLHKLGLKIGVITDCASSLEELWDGLTFSHLIDVPVFSSAVGIKKPAPEIYQIALDRLGLQANECLYIGDGGSFELTGAQNVGMTAIRIDGNKNPDVVQYELQDWQGTTITAISQVLSHLN